MSMETGLDQKHYLLYPWQVESSGVYTVVHKSQRGHLLWSHKLTQL